MHQMMYLKALMLYLLTWRITAARPESDQTSVGFPIYKYLHGYYTKMRVGSNEKEKEYSLAIASRTLTWIRCEGLFEGTAPKGYYTPVPGQIMTCEDPICGSVQEAECADQCNYQVKYGDYGSSTGLLVSDSVPLSLANGTEATPTLAFGCGLHQDYYPYNNSEVDGVLGLGKGDPSILAQLSKMKVTKNIVGHCFNQTNVGFLFFGDQFVPRSGIVWANISNGPNGYWGKADLQFDGKDTNIKGLEMVFDSGSHYTYFEDAAYGALISFVYTDELRKSNETYGPLSICWRRAEGKPFTSFHDAAGYFQPLALKFGDKAQFVLSPESYLVFQETGDVCLGILSSAVGDVRKNMNVIGVISMQNRFMVYDNEKYQVGWTDDCSSLWTMS